MAERKDNSIAGTLGGFFNKVFQDITQLTPKTVPITLFTLYQIEKAPLPPTIPTASSEPEKNASAQVTELAIQFASENDKKEFIAMAKMPAAVLDANAETNANTLYIPAAVEEHSGCLVTQFPSSAAAHAFLHWYQPDNAANIITKTGLYGIKFSDRKLAVLSLGEKSSAAIQGKIKYGALPPQDRSYALAPPKRVTFAAESGSLLALPLDVIRRLLPMLSTSADPSFALVSASTVMAQLNKACYQLMMSIQKDVFSDDKQKNAIAHRVISVPAVELQKLLNGVILDVYIVAPEQLDGCLNQLHMDETHANYVLTVRKRPADVQNKKNLEPELWYPEKNENGTTQLARVMLPEHDEYVKSELIKQFNQAKAEDKTCLQTAQITANGYEEAPLYNIIKRCHLHSYAADARDNSLYVALPVAQLDRIVVPFKNQLKKIFPTHQHLSVIMYPHQKQYARDKQPDQCRLRITLVALNHQSLIKFLSARSVSHYLLDYSIDFDVGTFSQMVTTICYTIRADQYLFAKNSLHLPKPESVSEQVCPLAIATQVAMSLGDERGTSCRALPAVKTQAREGELKLVLAFKHDAFPRDLTYLLKEKWRAENIASKPHKQIIFNGQDFSFECVEDNDCTQQFVTTASISISGEAAIKHFLIAYGFQHNNVDSYIEQEKMAIVANAPTSTASPAPQISSNTI